jgi:hypothetical protein
MLLAGEARGGDGPLAVAQGFRNAPALLQDVRVVPERPVIARNADGSGRVRVDLLRVFVEAVVRLDRGRRSRRTEIREIRLPPRGRDRGHLPEEREVASSLELGEEPVAERERVVRVDGQDRLVRRGPRDEGDRSQKRVRQDARHVDRGSLAGRRGFERWVETFRGLGRLGIEGGRGVFSRLAGIGRRDVRHEHAAHVEERPGVERLERTGKLSELPRDEPLRETRRQLHGERLSADRGEAVGAPVVGEDPQVNGGGGTPQIELEEEKLVAAVFLEEDLLDLVGVLLARGEQGPGARLDPGVVRIDDGDVGVAHEGLKERDEEQDPGGSDERLVGRVDAKDRFEKRDAVRRLAPRRHDPTSAAACAPERARGSSIRRAPCRSSFATRASGAALPRT